MYVRTLSDWAKLGHGVSVFVDLCVYSIQSHIHCHEDKGKRGRMY